MEPNAFALAGQERQVWQRLAGGVWPRVGSSPKICVWEGREVATQVNEPPAWHLGGRFDHVAGALPDMGDPEYRVGI